MDRQPSPLSVDLPLLPSAHSAGPPDELSSSPALIHSTKEPFLKGVGLSVWQNSTDADSNWTHFCNEKKWFGQQRYLEQYLKYNDFWTYYEQDIKLAHDLGCNSFRFSFEWARIEPQRGQIDAEAVQRYHQILDCLDQYGMEPMVTLHHFTHPQWFEEMNAFEVEENIKVFLNYCVTVFNAFSSRIKLWATFNEPTCFAFCGYIASIWCPGQLMQFSKCGQVLLHLLKAHVMAYRALKALPNGSTCSIGIVHQHCKFAPQSEGCYNFYVNPVTDWMTYWFATSVILNFFHTGEFTWVVPMWGETIQYKDTDAPSCLDWWGINYYTRICINWKFQMCGPSAADPLTDMDFPIYPQGLLQAIKEASILQVPIYITETGLADRADTLRAEYISQHCQEVLKAVSSGYDVRGLFWWTLKDNIEWHKGFEMKFGLYEWCPDIPGPASMKLREGSKQLIEFYKTIPSTVTEVNLGAEGMALGELGTTTMHEVDSRTRLLDEEDMDGV